MTDTEIINIITKRIYIQKLARQLTEQIIAPYSEPKPKTKSYIPNHKKVSLLTKKWSKECYEEFVVIDFETTGLTAANNYIIEIAAIRYKQGLEINKFFTLVKPPIPIPEKITKITGITDEMLVHAPTIDTVIHNLINFIGNSIIVAHNAPFDLTFLETIASKFNVKINNNVIDTLFTCRKLYPHFENHKLETICANLNIELNNHHRARADARVCAKILFKCMEEFAKHKIK